MDYDTMVARLNDAMDELTRTLQQLHDEPALVENTYWREQLESLGYEIGCALSTEDDV